jgi:hypothetical protein
MGRNRVRLVTTVMKMSTGKKLGIGGAMIVVALFAATLASGRLSAWLSPARPKNTWNSAAIQGTFAGVQVREIDPSEAALVFFYDLDNKTDIDYQLSPGPNLVIMSHLKSNGSLSAEEPIVLESAAFVPARNRTRIAVEVTHPFVWPQDTDSASPDKFQGFLQGETTDLNGFVLFDQPSRYEIELPGGWKDLQQISATAISN